MVSDSVVDGGVVANDERSELGEAREQELGEELGSGRWWVKLVGVDIEAGVLDAEGGVGEIESGEEQEESAAFGDVAE